MSDRTVTDHPSMNDLRAFGLGQLAGDAASAVEGHVSDCAECCRTLQGVGSDTLIRLVQAVTPPANPPEVLTLGSGSAADPQATAADASVGPVEVAECPPALRDHPRYRVLALLGKGGMGAVFKAEHKLMGRPVAIKVINQTLTSKPAIVERFRREVQAAARLAHPNIVAAHDAEQAGDTHFLVMEFVEGTDLARLVAERGRLSVAEACDYVRQAARGLQHAHERGMVHRDVKPHNLMRTPDGTIKVLDFGLARWASEAGSAAGGETGQGVLLGTVDYMAPEQADSAHAADVRSDIYSLGCTLYFLLAGRPPFPDGTLLQKVASHAGREPTPLTELRPDLPPGLLEVLHVMMAKSPTLRYQTPAQVDAALEPFASTRFGASTLLQPDARRAPARDSRRGWRRMAVGAAVLLGLLALAAYLAGPAVLRYANDEGELVIEIDDPQVQAVVDQTGVTLHDKANDRSYKVKPGRRDLKAGDYEVEVNEVGGDMHLFTKEFTITRGGTTPVKVTLDVSALTKKPAPPPPAKPEVLYRIPWQDEQQGFPAHIFHTEISSDGRLFFGSGDAGPTGTIRVWDVATGQQVQELVPGGDVWASFARFLPGGKYLAATYAREKDLYLWDVAAGKVVRKFVGHTDSGSAFAVSPDGKRLLSWADDKTVRLWDVDTGKELRKLEGYTDKAAGVFSPDGKQVLTFSPDKTLRLWDVESGKELKKLEGHTDACTGCFSPDGKQVLSYGGDNTLRMWDPATGKEVHRFEGPKAQVVFAGFVAGGRLVVGQSDEHSVDYPDDKKLRVWDAASGKLISEIDYGQYGGDGSQITASPDGRLALVPVVSDDSVRVLDLLTGKEIHRYDGCPKARAFSFTPDGTMAVAGSFRAGMYVFRLPSPE